ncbi:hypothetical protein ACLOJK_027739 [Asimina triloba]
MEKDERDDEEGKSMGSSGAVRSEIMGSLEAGRRSEMAMGGGRWFLTEAERTSEMAMKGDREGESPEKKERTGEGQNLDLGEGRECA